MIVFLHLQVMFFLIATVRSDAVQVTSGNYEDLKRESKVRTSTSG